MNLKKFEVTTQHPIRSPYEDVLRIDSAAKFDYEWCNNIHESLKKHESDPENHKYVSERLPWTLAKILQRMHGRGDPIGDVAERVVEAIRFTEHTRKQYPDTFLIADLVTPDSCGTMAICLLLAPDEKTLMSLNDLISATNNKRLYSFDIVMKAFMPGWQIEKKYNRKSRGKPIMAWSDAFTRAMASEDREASLEIYMQNFERYVKPFWPFKWKPWAKYKVEFGPEGDPIYGNAYHLFAFEVALAVCAYDLNDDGFRDHPYYPHELVDYYRAHIRGTRDAWRAQGIGSGVSIELPPKPKKMDLGKSKSKNFKRWLELVSDGDADATKSVIAACGNIKRMKEPHAVFEELNNSGIALCVDSKDDSSLEAALQALIESRDVKGYEAPETDYSGGPERCEALLKHATQFLSSSLYSLYVVDLRSDSYGAVLVRDEFATQFISLSQEYSVAFNSIK